MMEHRLGMDIGGWVCPLTHEHFIRTWTNSDKYGHLNECHRCAPENEPIAAKSKWKVITQ